MSLHIHVTHELSVENLPALQDQVRLRGGRLIAYSEVISVFFISARSLKVKWVATTEERKSAGIPSTLLTALLGWWGVVGPYWTLTAVIWNARGGFDVTDSLMRAHLGNPTLLGYSDAIALRASQDKSRQVAGLICIALVLILVGLISYLAWSSSRR